MKYEIDAVMYEREPGAWVAQCLQYDLGAQASTLKELRYQLQRAVVGYAVVSAETGVEPFHGLRPAPEEFWALWETAASE